MFHILIHQRVEQQVSHQFIALFRKMNLVPLGEAGLFPFPHRTESPHNVKQIPNACVTILSEPQKALLSQLAVRIHDIAFTAYPPETVVVGDEQQSAVGIHRTNLRHKHLIARGKIIHRKIRGGRIIDPDG